MGVVNNWSRSRTNERVAILKLAVAKGETENRVNERHPQVDVRVGSGKNSEGITREPQNKKAQTSVQ